MKRPRPTVTVGYVLSHCEHFQSTIVTEAPIPRPIIPADSIDNMVYGTLVGFAGFIVIV